MFQLQYTGLRPLTTAHLAQTMTLLTLTADELKQQIDSEIASNPALELVEERRCPMCHRILPATGLCGVCSRPQSDDFLEPVVFVSPREDFGGMKSAGVEDDVEDQISPASESLPEYVLRQIAPDLQPQDRKLAAFLLTHLNDDGLLTTSLMEVAQYFHIPLTRVEAVQRVIQRADPTGVGSVSPQEALLVQIEMLSETRSLPVAAKSIVEKTFDLLCKHQYSEMSKALGFPLRQVQEAAVFISENLSPFPARCHWGDGRRCSEPVGNIYHQPDIIISALEDNGRTRLMVEIIMPIMGTLQVNPMYRQALREAQADSVGPMKDDLNRAALFVKCIQQRNHTMQRMMQRLVVLQREFILEGEKKIKPITRVNIARELDVHESTISRAVNDKAVQLPNRRIIPLADFFDRSLNIRSVLREIISTEADPRSDSELVKLLSERGFSVARRTVAKYRSMEGILPAHLR